MTKKSTKQILKLITVKVKQKSKKAFRNQNKPEIPSYSSQIYTTVNEIFVFLHNSSNAVLDVLDHLIFLSDRFADIYPTQTTLGIKAGICRQYTNEKIRDLVNAEIIITKNQGHKKSLLYYLNPIFFRTDVRIKLRDLLPALRYRSLTALLLQHPTQTKKRDINNIYIGKKSEFYVTLEKIISSFYPSELKKLYKKMLDRSRRYATEQITSLLLGKYKPSPQLYTCPPVVRPKQKENPKKGDIMTVMTPVSMKDQELFNICKGYRKTCIIKQTHKTEDVPIKENKPRVLNKLMGLGKYLNLYNNNRLKGSSE